jgi:hypothetical protein
VDLTTANVAEVLPSFGERQARMVAAVLDVLPETSDILLL